MDRLQKAMARNEPTSDIEEEEANISSGISSNNRRHCHNRFLAHPTRPEKEFSSGQGQKKTEIGLNTKQVGVPTVPSAIIRPLFGHHLFFNIASKSAS
jgi:hypothetical protein